MISPYTGKEMKRICEQRTWNFRGEKYMYYHTSWRCEDTGEEFTTDESDNAGFMQVTNQYREKYGIPYTDEIISTRKRYGISASKMSIILGIGTNQYRLYEQGEVPSVSNGRMIRSINNPKVMLEMLRSSQNEMPEKEINKIGEKVCSEIDKRNEFFFEEYEIKRLFADMRGRKNDYAPVSIKRLKNILLYILHKCGEVWQTKMNKLLFFIDFLSYRERGTAISGLSYKALDFGPVPNRWDKVYSEFSEINQEIRQINNFTGNILIPKALPDTDYFSEDEIKIMDYVCERFSTCSSHMISDISHKEKAWKENSENHSQIPFDYAFSLTTL